MTSITVASVASSDKVDSAQPLVKLLPGVRVVVQVSDGREMSHVRPVSHVRYVVARQQHGRCVQTAAVASPVRLLTVNRVNRNLGRVEIIKI